MKAILRIIGFVFIVALAGCNTKANTEKVEEIISNSVMQESLFNKLMKITNESISEDKRADSLAFLLLPIDASCPACRKKTIDSISSNNGKLDNSHFVVISANSGLKTIRYFFTEQGCELPALSGNFFVDTVKQAFNDDLVYDKPTIYYTFNQKAYKKVASIPATIRKDLHHFFKAATNRQDD